MQNREITQQLQRLYDLIKKTPEACGENIELRSHWAKYICILSAGLIENALKEIYTTYATAQVSKPVARFVGSKLSQLRNPKMDRFYETAQAFNDTWKTELENFAADKGRGLAIDSIMANRHQIAHGKSQSSTITIAQIKDFLDKAVEVIEFVEQQCLR